MLCTKAKIAVLLLVPLAGPAQDQSAVAANEILSRVAEIHGAAGVFAVAGYRIGERALTELHENRGRRNRGWIPVRATCQV